MRRSGAVGLLATLLLSLAAVIIGAPPAAAQDPTFGPGTGVVGAGDNTWMQLADGTITGRSLPVDAQIPAGVQPVSVSTGLYHTLMLALDGRVYGWGNNTAGQVLGGAGQSAPVTLIPFPPRTRISMIAAGGYHSMALANDGRVFAWGNNDYGQLGLGTTTAVGQPTLITQLPPGVGVIAAGRYHSLAVAGSVYGWGLNSSGQVGDGTNTNRSTPVQVPGSSNLNLIAASSSGYHSIAGASLSNPATVLTWGANNRGQLGNGTTTDSNVPVPVPVDGLAFAFMLNNLGAGEAHTFIVDTGGLPYAWGGNNYGQLGDGTTVDRSTPVPVKFPGPDADSALVLMSISGGQGHSVAVDIYGTVYTWGYNRAGQLGVGDTTMRTTPVVMRLGAGTVSPTNLDFAPYQRSVDAGRWHTAVVVRGSASMAWGANDADQLGIGDSIDRNTPTKIAFPDNTLLTSIEAGYNHSLASLSNGDVHAWGKNESGQLGTGDTSDRPTPTRVLMPSGTNTTAVAGGQFHSLALTEDGRLYAWGRNNSGQLGLGDTNPRLTPTQITGFPTGTVITAIASHNVHNIALTSTGQIYTWGDNTYGQIGDGTTVARRTPTRIPLPPGFTAAAVAAGAFHTIAMTVGGGAYAWGYNTYGQLGDGSTTNRATPINVRIPSGTRITDIDAGLSHSLAITNTGRALAWGFNASGQLGSSSTTNSAVPVSVFLPANITISEISGGQSHSLAVIDTSTNTTYSPGDVLAWGLNNRGQLGDNTNTIRLTPVAVDQPDGTRASDVAGGQFHSLAR